MVGKIENRHQVGKSAKRSGKRKILHFGGSTIILLTQKGKAMPDPDIWENSLNGIETKSKAGRKRRERKETIKKS